MGRADLWAASARPADAWVGFEDRGFDAARLISQKTASITVTRIVGGSKTNLDAQNVYIAPMESRPDEAQIQSGGKEGDLRILFVGYLNHATIADTDIQRGDSVTVAGDSQRYEILQIIPQASTKRLLAVAEVSD